LNTIPHFRTVSGTPSFFLNGVSIDADPAWTLADWQQVLRVHFDRHALRITCRYQIIDPLLGLGKISITTRS
jgi:hypothetical protein